MPDATCQMQDACPQSGRQTRGKYYFLLVTSCLLFLFELFPVCSMAEEPNRVCVLPFGIHSKEDIGYLRGEMWDTLIDHLGKEQRIECVKRPTIEKILSKKAIISYKFTEEMARAIGLEINADYVVYGSLTKIGNYLSFDVRILEVLGGLIPIPVYVEGMGIENIAGILGQLAQEIMLKVLRRERIDQILITGNRRIEANAIKAVIESKEGNLFSPETLRSDLKSIFAMGYFDDVKIDVEDSPKGKLVNFIVTEKPSIREITVSGNKKIETVNLLEAIDIKAHSILNLKKAKEAVGRIKALYREKGYYMADVDCEVKYVNGEASIHYTIDEGKKFAVKRIKFLGNTAFSDKELKNLMSIKEKGLLSWIMGTGILKKDELENDRNKIAAYYYNHGYIKAKVGEPEVHLEEDGIVITLPIEEGPRYCIGQVDIVGDLIEPKEEMLKKIKITKEVACNREVLRRDILALSDMYADQGYAHVEVTPHIKIDEENKRVNVDININKGEKVYIDKIIITGNTKTRDKVIRRELKVQEKELFSSTALRQSSQMLNRLGYFEDVNLTTMETAPNKINLKVEVKEKPTGMFMIGGGYSSQEQLIGMAQITQPNLFGRGQELSVSAQLGSETRRYIISFTEPWVLDTRLSGTINAFNWMYEYEDFTRDTKGGEVRFGYPLGIFTRGYLGYRFENVDLSDVSEIASVFIRKSKHIHLTSVISGSLYRDSRDHPFFTNRGSINRFSLDYAGGPLGGDSQFLKGEINSGWFFPLMWDTVGFVRGSIGYAYETKEGRLPVYERFFLGGIYSLRGYETWEVGPRDPETNEIIGGNKMIFFNAEYMFPISKEMGVRGVVFFDTGNAYDDDEGYDFGNMRHCVGFGVRWHSPFGPLRIEWGYNLNPDPDQSQSNFQFSMGGLF